MKQCLECRESYPDSKRYCPTDGGLLSLQDPFHLVGKTLLDKYRIEALVGIGGMGAVYSAHHLKIDRRVAFKILLPHLAVGNANVLRLFEREARTAGQLSHENVVDIKDAGQTEDNLAYIVMEWLEGHTLDEEISKDGRLSLEHTSEILSQIAAALDAAHKRGIVHRDLKPSNVMLIAQPGGVRVKVVDFGIAKVISETSDSPVSRAMGTPQYASPEQFHVGEQLNERSDIYSLGAMVYQMLTGRCPFEAGSIHELMRLKLQETPRPLRQLCPKAPAAIEQLVSRMLARNPAQRPKSAGEVATLFKRALTSPDAAEASIGEAAPTLAVGFETPDTAGSPNATTQSMTSPLTEPITGAVAATNLNTRITSTNRSCVLVLSFAAAVMIAIPASWFVLRHRTAAPSIPAAEAPVAGPVSPAIPASIEVMKYKLGVVSKGRSQESLQSGSQALGAGQSFRFHFTPSISGHLYIIGPDDHEKPMTFLTAQPVADSGVKSNQLNAGVEFRFPGGQHAIEPARDEVYTLIFSREALPSPAFLTMKAGRTLTPAEQKELAEMRNRFGSNVRIVRPEDTGGESIIEMASNGPYPVIVDLTVKKQ